MASYFCGRRKEIAAISKTLKDRKSLVITGKFGVGRTSLVRYFAQLQEKPWRFLFCDFSHPPARMYNAFLEQMEPDRHHGKRHRYTDYRTCRKRLDASSRDDLFRYVIVMDNVSALTAQKLAFIRDLRWGKRFLFIAIAERFLSDEDLFRLRASLLPVDLLVLRNLSREESICFFRHFSEKHRLFWSASRIHTLVVATGGYPLMMRECVEKERECGKAIAR